MGNNVAYLIMLYKGCRLVKWCPVFIRHYLTNRIRDAVRGTDDQDQKETEPKGTNLRVNVGKPQRDKPPWGGNTSRLPPGSSIHKEDHRSLRTLA
jgi:hypothetical protein